MLEGELDVFMLVNDKNSSKLGKPHEKAWFCS